MRVAIDWDGTVTERDTLHMTIERFGDVEVFRNMDGRIGQDMTLTEVIGIEMATISAPLDEVVAWLLDTVVVRPGLAELVAAHAPLIVSAGFTELIGPVLEREGVAVEVLANRLDPRPDGWRARFLERDP
jgi:2-hydroxy-3-keto-5-methylthiopentenyl-1-phosphate phosphatase